jgi:ribosomal protein S18 acetylase RimI-like enzyme
MTAIRLFETDDIDFALRQKLREGWAVSREQFVLFPEHDPDGCFVAVENDRPVGMVTTTCFGLSGWIGNLIVEPEFRSRGIGRALMDHGIDRLRKCGVKAVRLEGDPPGIPLYRKLGFVDEFESCRFTYPGVFEQPSLDLTEIESMRADDLDQVAALDARITGPNRRRFLELKFEAAELALIYRRNGDVAAFLMAAPIDKGFRVGPCASLEPAFAQHLVSAAISAAAGRQVFVGIPAPNFDGIETLSEMGFLQGSSSIRMRLGPPVASGDPTRVFAISSGAVG